MQCWSFEELATNGRFPGACEIRSIYARTYEVTMIWGGMELAAWWPRCSFSFSFSFLSSSSVYHEYPISLESSVENFIGIEYIAPSPQNSRQQNVDGNALDFQMYRIADFCLRTGFLILHYYCYKPDFLSMKKYLKLYVYRNTHIGRRSDITEINDSS